MLSISKELFSAWNNARLLYCHWKSNEHLLPGLDGTTDLDVLLSLDDKKKGEEILSSLDFLKCKSQYGSIYPDVDDWLGFDSATGSLIHVHLHYSIVTGHKGMKEYSLPWTDLALKTRICNEEYNVYTIEPNLEIVTLFTRIGLKADFKSIIRCYFGKFKFQKDIQREIDWLKERIDFNKVYSLLEIFYGNKAKDVYSIIQNERIEASTYLHLRKIAESTFNKSSRVKCFRRVKEFSFFLYKHYLMKLLKKFRPVMSKKVPLSEKGLTIAFLGQDGAGKTTVTNHLIKWWSWKMDVRYIYLGSGDNYSSWKKSFVHKLRGNGSMKYLSTFLTLLDFREITKKAYKNIIKAEKYAQKGGIVIYDRYPQIEFEGICDGPKIRKRLHSYFGNGMMARLLMPLAKSEERYIKKIVKHDPTIVFKLILPPEESIRRKPHENFDAIKQKHEIIKTLKFDQSDEYTIDATMPFDEEMVLIKNIIWQHIQ